jgi:DNA-directed RNA polymerase subunit RPC12/RpoP
MGDNDMIYVCAKCEFLFERKNEPSKCPSCENQSVLDASKEKQQEYKRLHGSKRDVKPHPDSSSNKT